MISSLPSSPVAKLKLTFLQSCQTIGESLPANQSQCVASNTGLQALVCRKDQVAIILYIGRREYLSLLVQIALVIIWFHQD